MWLRLDFLRQSLISAPSLSGCCGVSTTGSRNVVLRCQTADRERERALATLEHSAPAIPAKTNHRHFETLDVIGDGDANDWIDLSDDMDNIDNNVAVGKMVMVTGVREG